MVVLSFTISLANVMVVTIDFDILAVALGPQNQGFVC